VINKLTELLKFKIPYTSAVIVAAGSSERMGFNKITASLNGIPVIAWTVKRFQDSANIREIVIVTRQESIAEVADIVKEYNLTKVSKVICGGKTRTESSFYGVFEANEKAKLIAIHDGARPLVTTELIDSVLLSAAKNVAACPGVKPTDTVKSVSDRGYVAKTIDRDKTILVQTPQVFDSDLIKGALTKAIEEQLTITDDCSAAEQFGARILVENGDPYNIKLTTPLDFYLAEKIMTDRGDAF